MCVEATTISRSASRSYAALVIAFVSQCNHNTSISLSARFNDSFINGTGRTLLLLLLRAQLTVRSHARIAISRAGEGKKTFDDRPTERYTCQ